MSPRLKIKDHVTISTEAEGGTKVWEMERRNQKLPRVKISSSLGLLKRFRFLGTTRTEKRQVYIKRLRITELFAMGDQSSTCSSPKFEILCRKACCPRGPEILEFSSKGQYPEYYILLALCTTCFSLLGVFENSGSHGTFETKQCVVRNSDR